MYSVVVRRNLKCRIWSIKANKEKYTNRKYRNKNRSRSKGKDKDKVRNKYKDKDRDQNKSKNRKPIITR